MSAEAWLILVAGGVLAVAAAASLGPRVGVAAPLVLVALGTVVSVLPGVPDVEVEPEWVLVGVLPPLLYASAVSLPAMDLRRSIGAISGLSVVLVVLSALLLGLLFSLLVPSLPLGWGIALGAIVSPTDSVATSIVKGLGASGRVVTMLDGESLLNDATALVLLRTAVAGAGASVSLGGAVGHFAFSVVAALVIGSVVGHANVWVRARVPEAAAATAVSLTVPFLASVPAEAVGASGLVAAVAAGLVAGRHGAEWLTPQQRLSDQQTWRTVELVLEGGVFLLLGLELAAILGDVGGEAARVSVSGAALIAAAGLAGTLVVRAAYVAPLVALLQAKARRSASVRERLDRVDLTGDPVAAVEQLRGREATRRPRSQEQIDRWRRRLTQFARDIDHLLAHPVRPRDGLLIVWAGMRGAVTVAAAQTLPEDAPSRSLLVLVAFFIAVGSLALQGLTLPALVRRLGTPANDAEAEARDRAALVGLMRAAAAEVGETDDRRGDALARLEAQRHALLAAREEGTFESGALAAALQVVDADQISIELRGAG